MNKIFRGIIPLLILTFILFQGCGPKDLREKALDRPGDKVVQKWPSIDKKATDREIEDSNRLVEEAEKLIERQIYVDAHRNLNEAVNLNPRNLKAYRMLADFYFQQRDFENTAKALEQAAAIAPDDLSLRKELAEAYRVQNKFEDEIKIRKEVLKAEPSGLDNYLKLAAAYKNSGNVESAEKTYEAAAEKLTGKPDAVFEYSKFYFREASELADNKQKKKAVSTYRKAINKAEDFLKVTKDEKKKAEADFYIAFLKYRIWKLTADQTDEKAALEAFRGFRSSYPDHDWNRSVSLYIDEINYVASDIPVPVEPPPGVEPPRRPDDNNAPGFEMPDDQKANPSP